MAPHRQAHDSLREEGVANAEVEAGETTGGEAKSSETIHPLVTAGIANETAEGTSVSERTVDLPEGVEGVGTTITIAPPPPWDIPAAHPLGTTTGHPADLL